MAKRLRVAWALGSILVVGSKLSASDGRSGGEAAQVVFTDDSRGPAFAKDPSVIRFRDHYWMYYSLAGSHDNGTTRDWSIGIARSHDLTAWTKVGEVPPGEGPESKGIAAPCAVVIGGRVHLFYQTYGNGKADAICHATSEDGLVFTRNPTNPIFSPTGAWNCGRAIDAEVVIRGDRALLFYATRDPAFERQMLGVAEASVADGFSRGSWIHLSPHGPILEPQLDWEKKCIEAATVVVRGERLIMFYAGGYNNEPQQIGVAESEDGRTWRRMRTEPLVTNGPAGSWNESESGHPCLFVDEQGATHLFFQGNNTRGKTWSIARLAVTWNGLTPAISPSVAK